MPDPAADPLEDDALENLDDTVVEEEFEEAPEPEPEPADDGPRVLACPAAGLPAEPPADGFAPLATPPRGEFVLRGPAESDETLRQLIPYVLVVRPPTNGNFADSKLATYRRPGGDARLKGMRSCGFGGHVDPPDAADVDPADQAAVCAAAVARELGPGEELGLSPDDYELTYLGLLDDRSDHVGRVHLGLLYVAELNSGAVCDASEETGAVEFLPLPQALAAQKENPDEWETWSRIAARAFVQLRRGK